MKHPNEKSRSVHSRCTPDQGHCKRIFFKSERYCKLGQLTQSAVHEEGYIKFDARWEQTPPLVGVYPKELLDWRNRLFVHGLIGMLPDGIGYGNVSERLRGDTFLITGSARLSARTDPLLGSTRQLRGKSPSTLKHLESRALDWVGYLLR